MAISVVVIVVVGIVVVDVDVVVVVVIGASRASWVWGRWCIASWCDRRVLLCTSCAPWNRQVLLPWRRCQGMSVSGLLALGSSSTNVVSLRSPDSRRVMLGVGSGVVFFALFVGDGGGV